MKTINRVLGVLLFIAAASINNSAKGQTMSSNQWRFGIGIEGGVPTEDIHGYSKVMFGATGRLQYTDPASNLAFTLTSGYYNFYVHNFTTPTTTLGPYTYNTTPHNLGVIPVKVGIKGFVGKSIYLNAEGGVGFETSYNQDRKMILSPGIGWANSAIDLSLRYESLSGDRTNYGFVGLRLAYGFGL